MDCVSLVVLRTMTASLDQFVEMVSVYLVVILMLIVLNQLNVLLVSVPLVVQGILIALLDQDAVVVFVKLVADLTLNVQSKGLFVPMDSVSPDAVPTQNAPFQPSAQIIFVT